MSNSQVRLLSAAIALLAGGVLANTYNIDDRPPLLAPGVAVRSIL